MEKAMTKTTAKSATPGADYFASIQQAFENAQASSKFRLLRATS
jgi:hypothetical protein